jgi:membrane glycosyltransferase
MGRVHLGLGAAAYIVSAVWAASLAVGVVLALQGQHVIPSYFHDAKSLFPLWPVIDPGAAFRLFLATMVVVLMPKAFGLVLETRRAALAGNYLAAPRIAAAVLLETALSMLFAPIFMATQTTAVAQILAGLDSGWKAQRRDGAGIGFLEVLKFHRWHMLVGVSLALLTYLVAWSLMAWMSAILLGLSLSALLSWWTARRADRLLSYIFATKEDWQVPAILAETKARAERWSRLGLPGGPQEAVSLSKAA